jgi:hypothetical protein
MVGNHHDDHSAAGLPNCLSLLDRISSCGSGKSQQMTRRRASGYSDSVGRAWAHMRCLRMSKCLLLLSQNTDNAAHRKRNEPAHSFPIRVLLSLTRDRVQPRSTKGSFAIKIGTFRPPTSSPVGAPSLDHITPTLCRDFSLLPSNTGLCQYPSSFCVQDHGPHSTLKSTLIMTVY